MLRIFIIIIFSFLIALPLFCQSEKEETVLAFSAGIGYIPFTGSINNYFNPTIGGTISLDLYKNRMAYYLSFSGTPVKLKQDLSTDGIWSKGSENSFFSYGLTAGYSIYNKGVFRMTPFAGLMLSQSRPSSSDMKEYDHLNKYDVGPALSPAFGLNMTFHFKNTDKKDYEKLYGPDFRISLNARITYVPSAIRSKDVPYKGSIWYLAIGVSMELFTKN